jgi:hypothetical protein
MKHQSGMDCRPLLALVALGLILAIIAVFPTAGAAARGGCGVPLSQPEEAGRACGRGLPSSPNREGRPCA